MCGELRYNYLYRESSKQKYKNRLNGFETFIFNFRRRFDKER